MADLTVDQAFGQEGTPTIDAAFGPEKALTQPRGSFAGGIADWFFSDTVEGRVLNSFGQGVKQGWGAALEGSKESDDWLKKVGIYNDWEKGRSNYVKSLNETFLRPVIYGARSAFLGAMGGLQGLTEGVSGELQGKGEELINQPGFGPSKALGYGLGALGEVVGGVSQGFGPELLNPMHGSLVARARAVIGEGERGYFNSAPVKPELLEERVKAANETGVLPPKLEEPIIDSNFIARRMNPDLFNEWDRLAEQLDTLRAQRDYAESQIGTMTGVRGFKRDQELSQFVLGQAEKIQAVDEKLRDLIPKAADVREQAELNLKGTTPEAERFRKWAQAEVLETWFKRQDIEPQVQAVLSQAESLVPSPTERLEIQLKERQKAESQKEGAVVDVKTKTESPAQEIMNEVKSTASPVVNKAIEEGTLGPKEPTLKGVEGTGAERTRGLSQSVEASVVEKGIIDAFEDLPNYKQINIKDQVAKATALVENDYQAAKRIAMGLDDAPDGLYPESVFIAVEKQALANQDVALLRLLATRGKLSEQSTIMGQRTRMLGERDKDFSPVAIIEDVEKLRKKTLDNQKLQDQKQQIIDAGEAAIAEFKEDWDAFLNAIMCK